MGVCNFAGIMLQELNYRVASTDASIAVDTEKARVSNHWAMPQDFDTATAEAFTDAFAVEQF